MKPKQSNNKKQLLPFVSPFLSPGFQRSLENSDMDWSIDIPQASASSFLYVPHLFCMFLLQVNMFHHLMFYYIIRVQMARTEQNLLHPWYQIMMKVNWQLKALRMELTIYYLYLEQEILPSKMLNQCLNPSKELGVTSNIIQWTRGYQREFIPIVKQLWKLIDNIYVAKWDVLIFDKEKTLTIKKCVEEHIMPYYRQNQPFVKNEGSGLNIFLFSSFISIFFSIYFLYSIFRTRVRVRVTRSCCHTAGHIR